MSLFLGKIHYWLFNKILWFEGLTDELLVVGEEEGLDVDTIQSEIINTVGEKLPNKPLEELIDTSNIHGWLQEQIHMSEKRVASWIKALMDNNIDMKKIENVFFEQGIKAGKEVKENYGVLDSATNIFNAMNDYILDGMPCDRVNNILASEEDKVEWVKTTCVHKDLWNESGVDVKIFYDLRKVWCESFVREINNEFSYVEEKEVFRISK